MKDKTPYNTTKTYNQSIKKFKEKNKLKDDEDILNMDASKIILLIDNIYAENEKSRVVMLSAIQNLFKNLNEKERYKKENIKKMETLSGQITKYNNISQKKDKKGIYNKEELKKYVKWSEILEKSKKYLSSDASPENKLIVGLYTLIPPRRSEYYNLVYTSKNPNNSQKNFLYKSDKGLILHIGDYKTRRAYGIVQIKIYKVSPELEKLFKNYIETYNIKEGDLIFSKVGINKDNSFIARINSLFGDILHNDKETIGINLLRHSFINDFLKSPRSVEEREKVGYMLGHSPMMMLYYDKKDKNGEIPE
jgi:hypothetical protein